VPDTSSRRPVCPPPGRRGFTLIELLVALAVISVAVSVFMSLYISSLDLAAGAHQRQLAMNLAHEQLAAITTSPGAFVWELPEDGAEETRFPIELTGEDPNAGNEGGTPQAMPPEPSAYEKQIAEHEKFRWKATGRLQAGGGYYDVIVEVRWRHQGKPQFLAITSAVPAIDVEQALETQS